MLFAWGSLINCAAGALSTRGRLRTRISHPAQVWRSGKALAVQPLMQPSRTLFGTPESPMHLVCVSSITTHPTTY
jgi:hypothetical protein